jgi:hypothetical protein
MAVCTVELNTCREGIVVITGRSRLALIELVNGGLGGVHVAETELL